jgi:LuxR family maltose regulon positive regulatory protein
LETALRAPLAAQQVVGSIRTLATLALVSLQLGEDTRAADLAQRAMQLAEQHQLSSYPCLWLVYVARGMVLAHEGALEEAESVLAAGVEPHLDWLRTWPLYHALALLALVPVRHGRGHATAARTLLEEARVALRSCRDPGMLPDLLTSIERELGRLPRQRTGLREDLSDGELRILRLLAGNLSQREIGRELYLSVNTVKSHTRAIYTKLDAASRTEAVARARSLGLIP